jgi:hypothetical protein
MSFGIEFGASMVTNHGVAGSLAVAEGHCGAIAFSRTGDPAIGDFKDAVILRTVGEVDVGLLTGWLTDLCYPREGIDCTFDLRLFTLKMTPLLGRKSWTVIASNHRPQPLSSKKIGKDIER